MNNMDLLLMDKPIENSTKSFTMTHSKQDNNHRSNFHDVLSKRTVQSEKGQSVISQDMISHLKKILNQNSLPTEEVTSVMEDLKIKLSQILEIDELSEIEESLIHQLLEALIKNESIFFDEELPEDNLLQMLSNKLKLLMEMDDDGTQLINSNESMYLMIEPLVNEQSEDMQIQLQQLLRGITEVLANLTSDKQSIKETSSRVLALLEQWSQLSKGAKLSLNNSLQESVSEEELKRWEKLSDIFIKRQSQQKNGNYRAEATVTRRDVSKWLHQLVPENSHYKGYSMALHQDLARPMTQIEQYIVHVQPSDKVERVSNDLMKKMMSIVQQSQFMKPSNQTQQLSLMIRPENLGNMTLHFTQMNGDMVVKIMVSSQMAKEMLETNIHQLKHLFSPHQVIIERDTTISDEQFYNKDYEEDQSEHEESTGETNEEQQPNQDEESEQIDFESLLEMTKEGG